VDIPRFRELQLKMSLAMHFTAKLPPPNLRFNFSGLVEAGNLVPVGSDWAFGMTLPPFLSVAYLVDKAVDVRPGPSSVLAASRVSCLEASICLQSQVVHVKVTKEAVARFVVKSLGRQFG
jgi:hypothetical protein